LVTSIEGPRVPEYAALYQNHPNPFNPVTVIRYDVPRGGGDVHLSVYDVSGRLVRELVSWRESPGEKTVRWDGRADAGVAVSTGVYFYRITIGKFTATRKMVLLK
jgi:flagellar hook assembly protein FlgD